MVVVVAEKALGTVLNHLAGKILLRLCFILRYKMGRSLPATIDDIEVSDHSLMFNFCILLCF